MMERKESNFIEGLILGGLMGIILGIFFSPAAGEKMRAGLKEKLKEFDLDEIIDRFHEAYNEGLKKAEEVMEEEEG